MNIESTRFGQLDVSEADIIKFPQGLYGFPGEKSFVLISHQIDSPFAFLQSASEPNLTFLLLETLKISKEYEFKLDDQIVEELNLSPDKTPLIYNIVNNTAKADDMTVNLLAPIIVNIKKCLAQQVIIENTNYKHRHRLFIEGASQKIKDIKK